MSRDIDIPYAREKLIHAMLYFTEKIQNSTLGKLKMLKLLYLLDFEHYRQTGRPSIGLEYRAWKMGPVAADLYDELKSPAPDIAKHIRITNRTDELDEITSGLQFSILQKFDEKFFSRREKMILDRIVEFCCEVYSKDMVQLTHGKGMPWRKVWDNGRGNNKIIDYDLILGTQPLMADKESITTEYLQELKEIDNGFRAAFSSTSRSGSGS